ncbi:MspA family porin [Tsukamurella sp. 8F]|uniref:MspA family porin n=1 Tax=unclassified Tsukamurella TaxID=2633480 RepID=UPI0023B8D4EC|nr:MULTISPECIES: MspA family porin [unclassified Tsukamurella]MDF0531405.1 MspA family porin [Tsukamurella sp. 8J]MDF0585289.1 MspA family porin [Tsukamurella sp. 8F]
MRPQTPRLVFMVVADISRTLVAYGDRRPGIRAYQQEECVPTPRTGAVVAAVAAATVLSTATAHADTYVPLPNGEKQVATAGEFSVKLRSTNNHAKILPSLATAQTRTTWVSSTGSVDVKGAGKDVDGTLNVSLMSGCQFPGAIGASLGVTGPGATAGTGNLLGDPSPEVGASLGGVKGGLDIPLSPGTTKGVTGNTKDYPWSSVLDNVSIKKDGTYNVSVKDYDVNFENCSGYAQARVVTWVELKGSNRVQGYLYGKPFSLG